MAAERKQFEVFNNLRDLGRSLDKISNDLPADENTERPSKARASLQLKALLTDAKNFKAEASKQIAEMKSRQNFASVLANYQKQASKIRSDIESLQNHLTKYGYKKPEGKLPEIPSLDEVDINENNDHLKSENAQSSSNDKGYHSPRTEQEATVEKKEFQEEEQPTKQPKPEEIDFLASPVRPTTFTKFLEAIESDEEHPSSPKSLGTQDTIQSPTLPTIQTPAGNKTTQFVNSPMLPVLQTPGLGSKTTATSTQWNYLNTPPPPVIQSCKLLRLEDLESDDTKNTSAQFKPAAKTYNLSDVNDELYQNLPGSVQRQFSVEQLNLLIRQINTYLNERNQGNDVVTDEDLVSVLQLGPLSRVFALAMLKLEYFTIKKSGVYSVHEKVIVYDVVHDDIMKCDEMI